MIVPLGTEAYKRDAGLVPEVQCYNFFLEKDESGISPDRTIRVQRPGLVTFTTITSPVRALQINPANRDRLTVGAATFNINSVPIGSVGAASNEQARIAVTQLTVGIYNNGEIYIYRYSDDTLYAVTIPDGTPVDIDQLNGYFIVLCSDGRFYWILPGEVTIDALNFATAESSNDMAVFVRQIGNEFWIGGGRTVEPWQATGDFDLPFAPATGRVLPHGALDPITAQRFDNTLVWVGDDCNVYRGGGVAQVISTPAIAERIRKRSLILHEVPVTMAAWCFTLDAHSFYVLYIPGQGTFAYDAATQQWSQWARAGSTIWPWVGDSFAGVLWAGDLDSGKVWNVSADLSGDDAVAFTRLLTGTLPVLGKPPRNDSLSVGVGASVDCNVRIRWRDGQEDYPVGYYDELPVRAPFDVASLYRLGQPQQPYREVEISFTDAAFVRVAGCLANQGWQ